MFIRNLLNRLHSSLYSDTIEESYRGCVKTRASNLFSDLLNSADSPITGKNELNILVIGAGTFPGYVPFINALLSSNKSLQTIKLTVVEPSKFSSNYFTHSLEQANKELSRQIQIDCSVANSEIKDYLQSSDNKYDVIYLEQPNFTRMGLLLEKLGLKMTTHNSTMREAIPYLYNVMREHTLVIASCLHNQDLYTLQSLLQLSYQHSANIKKPAGNVKDGSPYSSGLTLAINTSNLNSFNPECTAKKIHKFDDIYFYCLLLSVILFILTPSWLKVLSFFLTIALLFNHQYYKSKLLYRLTLLFAQSGFLGLALFCFR